MNLKKLAGRSEFMYQSSRKGREMESSMDNVLTVIVHVYNMEKYIRQCLESLVIGGGAGGVGWLQGWFCGDRV